MTRFSPRASSASSDRSADRRPAASVPERESELGNGPAATLVPGTVNFSADPATLKQQVERELRTASPAAASPVAPPVTRQLRECVQKHRGRLRINRARGQAHA